MVILTDLSEVLIGGMSDVIWLISKKYGKEACRKFQSRLRETEEYFDNMERGKMTEKGFCDIFFMRQGLPFSRKEISKLFSQSFRLTVPGTLKLYQRITSYPERIATHSNQKSGMPDIYIVSDHIAERIDEIKDYHPGLFDVVSGEFWSCKTGWLKRDPYYFEAILNELGIRADEAIFIDDDSANIEAAEKAGIYSIIFTGSDRLEQSLEELGFVITQPVP